MLAVAAVAAHGTASERQELCDLRVDPREHRNVAGANRERVWELRARIGAWREKVEGPGAL